MRVANWILAGVMLGVQWSGMAMAIEQSPSVAQERRLDSLAIKEQMDREMSLIVVRDAEMDAFLRQVAARLWTHAQSDLAVPTIKTVQEVTPNAQTYSNGVIYLTTGILVRTCNEDQLAMILAHEMVHYIRRHTLLAFKHSQIGGVLGHSEHGQDLKALCDAAEEQADAEGLTLMRAVGYCPDQVVPLLRSFQNIPEKEQADGFLTLSNPYSIKNRIDRIQALLSQVSAQEAHGTVLDPQPKYISCIAPAFLANTQAAAQKGLWGQAEESIRLYLALRPSDPQAHFLQGEVESQVTHRLDRAAACYQRAIGLDRSFVPAHRALGFIHFKAGHLQEARTYFETSLALAPQDPVNDYIRGYLQLCVY